MKRIILLCLLAFLGTSLTNAQETMYIMKHGEVIGEHVINTEFDSIIFYAPPPPAPISVSSINFNLAEETMFIGQTLDLNTYLNILPANATDKSVTWNITGSSTSTVNAGIVTAGSIEESFTVSATTNDGSNLSASITVNVSQELPNTYYQGAIANAKYIGRWKKEGAFDRSGYNGAMIKVNFTGRNATLNLSDGWSPTTNLFWRIDGGAWILKTGQRVSVNLTATLSLDSGEHTLEIVAGANGGAGVSPDNVIISGTLVLDPDEQTLPPTDISTKHIDFIGDSISTICYEDDTPDEHWNWLIGEALGWEHAHIAMPSMTTAFMAAAYNKFYSSTGTWNFATGYKTHAIVVNLGQNDGGKPSVATYKAAIQSIRSNWVGIMDNIPIICIGLFWDLGNGADVNIETAVNELKAAGDADVYYLGDAVGLAASLHPQDGEHQVISNALTPKIQEILNSYY